MFVVAATGWTSAAVADHVDSMYKTSRANYDCFDGTLRRGALCQTDNAALTVYRQASVRASGKRNIRTTLNNSYDTTDLDVRFTRPVYTGSAETDVIYRVRDVPGTAVGITFCNDAVTDTKCDQHYVTFQNQPGRAIACHETGHAVGLLHPTDADPRRSEFNPRFRCMTNVPTSPFLGLHNSRQIDSTY